MRNVTKIAKLMNSRSRMCTICPLGKQMRCNLDIMRVCSDAFVEGFKKGVQLAEINVVQNSGGFATLFTPDLFDFSVVDYTGFNPDDGSLENRVVLQMYR